jgi:hypothetical protein
VGTDTTTTLSEIAATRQRLASNLDELERRVRPDGDLADHARRVGAAVAAAVVSLLTLVGLARRGVRRRREHHHAQVQAEALVDLLEQRGWSSTTHPGRQPEQDRATTALVVAMAALAATVANLLGRRRGAN